MPNYPHPPADPCWALFDDGGLQICWPVPNDSNRTAQEQETLAFTTLNANRDNAAVYIVKCLWQEPSDHTTFYEQGDRVTAPMGEDPDREPA